MQKTDRNLTGRVFNIQRCSLHDGPGVRTTVFMKGCPLRCTWCQNPEGLSREISLTYDAKKCISCGSCRGERSIQAALLCPTEALSTFGKDYTPDELVDELCEDADFFIGEGGVTFSGGECLVQGDFVFECSKILHGKGIRVAIDTCGEVDFSQIERLIPYTQIFLYDLKCADPEKHRLFTGVSNERIIKNLERLCLSGARVWIRVPIVGTFNADPDEARAIRDILDRLSSVEKVEALRYHELGLHKYHLLGMDHSLSENANISDALFDQIKSIIEKR